MCQFGVLWVCSTIGLIECNVRLVWPPQNGRNVECCAETWEPRRKQTRNWPFTLSLLAAQLKTGGSRRSSTANSKVHRDLSQLCILNVCTLLGSYSCVFVFVIEFIAKQPTDRPTNNHWLLLDKVWKPFIAESIRFNVFSGTLSTSFLDTLSARCMHAWVHDQTRNSRWKWSNKSVPNKIL